MDKFSSAGASGVEVDESSTGGAGEGMEDLDVFEGDWGGSDMMPGMMASNQTVGPGGGATIIPSSSSSSAGGPSGLSMRRSFKSTLTRLSDGSGRRMRKTSRSSLLGDKDKGEVGSDSSTAASTAAGGRMGNGGQPGSPSTLKNQSQMQQRGLGWGRPELETVGSGSGVGRKMGGGIPKDTHFFDTVAEYSGLSIPIRIPLSIFPEEVGDVSRRRVWGECGKVVPWLISSFVRPPPSTRSSN